MVCTHVSVHTVIVTTVTPELLFSLTRGGTVRQLSVQELCESRGGRPGLSDLTSLMVSVDVKQC